MDTLLFTGINNSNVIFAKKKEQLFYSKVSHIVVFVFICLSAQGQYVTEFKSILLPEFYGKALLTEDSIKQLDPYNMALKYLDLGRSALNHNEILASKYEVQAKKIFIDLKIDSMVADVNLSLSFPYINLGMYDEAQAVIEEVVTYAKNQRNKGKLGQAYLRYGFLEQARGRYDKSLSYYLNTLDIYKKIYPLEKLGDVTNRLGSTYIEIGDCNSAIALYEDYLNALKKINKRTNFQTTIESNLASCYIATNVSDKARQLLQGVIAAFKKSTNPKLISSAYSKMSKVALLENKTNEAILLLDTAMIYGRSYNNNKTLAALYLAKGKLYLNYKTNYRSAILCFDNSLNYALKGNTPETQKECYDAMAKAYSLQKNFTKAYLYSTKADSLKSVLYSNEVITSIKNIEKARLEKKSNEQIALLNEQNNLKNLNLSNQKLINKIISLLAALLSLFLLGIVYTLHQRNANNRALSNKNEIIEKALDTNKMLVKEIHHRVKNNLQIVSSLLGLQTRYTQDKKVEEALIESRARIQAMSILHQSLYNKNSHSKVALKQYFEELCENISITFRKSNENVEISTHFEDIFLDFDQTITLGIIINELITNAFKHAFKNKPTGIINLHLYKHQDTITVLYNDDGIGLPYKKLPDKPHSMGMQIIKSFLEKLDAQYVINNTKGFEIEIKFVEENEDIKYSK